MSVIDQQTFDTLKESMGEELIPTLIDAFLRDGLAQIETMRNAAAENDADAFRRAAHSLKSNALTFGAADLAAQARELENMAREKNLEIGNRLQVLNDAFKLVRHTLQEMS